MMTTKKTKKATNNHPNPTTTSPSAGAPTAATSTTGQAPTPPATQAQTTTPATPTVTGIATATGRKAAKTDLQASYVALIAGLQSIYQPTDVFQLETGDETCADLVADFQGLVSASEKTKASNKVWRADVQAEKQVLTAVAPKRVALVRVLHARYGTTGAQLLQFGIAPQQPHKASAKALVAGQAKAEATRQARGTKGSKQKLEVSGNVTGVTITPVTSGSATTQATQPETAATQATAPAPAAAAGSAAKS
jgi:hypothetical protein